MLIHARHARMAHAMAPLQERSAIAISRIRSLLAPSMQYWAHTRLTFATSGTVGEVKDTSNLGISFTQATASKQPAAGTTSNVRCWIFDGVNDCLQTPTIDLTAKTKMTLAVVHRAASTVGGAIYEQSPNQNNVTDGWGFFQNDFAANRLSSGGQVAATLYNYKEFSASTGQWRSICISWDRTAAGADELNLFDNGAKVVAFTNSYIANATNTFGNYTHNIGSRNNGASYAANCSISSVMLINGALTDQDASNLSILMRQAAGIA